jgi:hypothetical protein
MSRKYIWAGKQYRKEKAGRRRMRRAMKDNGREHRCLLIRSKR